MDSAMGPGGLPPWWRKAVVSVGAAAALAIVIHRLRRQGDAAKAAAPAAPVPPGEMNGKAAHAATRSQPAPSAPAPAAQSAATSEGGIAAQRAAALSTGGEGLGPNFDLPLMEDLERRLRARYSPIYLDLQDLGGNCGAAKIGIVIVSEAFSGQTRVNRERAIQGLFKADLETNRVHALQPIKASTPKEYQAALARQAEQAKSEQS